MPASPSPIRSARRIATSSVRRPLRSRLWRGVRTTLWTALGAAALIGLGLSAEAPAPRAEAAAAAPNADARRARCVDGMLEGYGSGLEETYCRAAFDLPSPFYFKCARGLRKGFHTETARAACAHFFESASARAAEGWVRRAAR